MGGGFLLLFSVAHATLNNQKKPMPIRNPVHLLRTLWQLLYIVLEVAYLMGSSYLRYTKYERNTGDIKREKFPKKDH